MLPLGVSVWPSQERWEKKGTLLNDFWVRGHQPSPGRPPVQQGFLIPTGRPLLSPGIPISLVRTENHAGLVWATSWWGGITLDLH